jgi:hypothetical protein
MPPANNLMQNLGIKNGIIFIISAFFPIISGLIIKNNFNSVNNKGAVKGASISIRVTTPTNSPIPTLTPTIYITPTETDTPTPRPTATPRPTPVPPETMENWFTQYANHYSIDRQYLRKIAVCESNLRPYATNGIYGGMYQFDPAAWKATRRQMNLDGNPELRFNPEEAIRTAAFKISVNGNRAWPNCGKQ